MYALAIRPLTTICWRRTLTVFSTIVLCIELAACGGGGGSGSPASNGSTGGNAGATKVGLFLIAGNIGGSGAVDAVGIAARFTNPTGITTDAASNVYVADTVSHTIRKISSTGVVTTLAGMTEQPGSADGTGVEARFNFPSGISTDGGGNLYIADTFNSTIRKIDTAGAVSTVAGTVAVTGSTDGLGAAAQFNFPSGITVDAAGNLYVADTLNNSIRKISPAGVVSTLAGMAGQFGIDDDTGAAARFNFPGGIIVDSAGTLYVADTVNHAIREVSAAGIVTTLAGEKGLPGSADGLYPDVRFNLPQGITVDAAGNKYVADTSNSTIRMISPAGQVTKVAGRTELRNGQTVGLIGSDDGDVATALFNQPFGITRDASGNLYIADTFNHTIRKIDPAMTVTTLAGMAEQFGSTDGNGADARFKSPTGITADAAGNLYVADSDNKNTIRKINPAGVVTTIAGKANPSVGGAIGLVNEPFGIVADSAGNLYLADSDESTIRKISATGAVTTVAGSAGLTGSNDGTGSAARFNHPEGITIDTQGNLYVVDTSNHTVRKITPTGVVTTLAAQFNAPSGIAADGAGNLFVADTANHTIRKIDGSGIVATLAGTAGVPGSADGKGLAARFHSPIGITIDATGNLYVADRDNHAVRKITPDSEVTTLAGTSGGRGIVLGDLPGGLDSPVGITLTGPNTLAITTGNSVLGLRVR